MKLFIKKYDNNVEEFNGNKEEMISIILKEFPDSSLEEYSYCLDSDIVWCTECPYSSEIYFEQKALIATTEELLDNLVMISCDDV